MLSLKRGNKKWAPDLLQVFTRLGKAECDFHWSGNVCSVPFKKLCDSCGNFYFIIFSGYEKLGCDFLNKDDFCDKPKQN